MRSRATEPICLRCPLCGVQVQAARMRSREILNTMLPSFVVAKMLSATHRDSRQVSLSGLLVSRTTPVLEDCKGVHRVLDHSYAASGSRVFYAFQADEHAKCHTLLFVFATTFFVCSLLRRRRFSQSRLCLFLAAGW